MEGRENEIRTIKAEDPGEGEAKSVNQDVTSLDPITSDYIPRGVSARLVVARFFYGNTTGFTNCFATFSLSSYLSSPLSVSYPRFL